MPRTDRPTSRNLSRLVTVVFAVAVIANSVGAVIALENNADRIRQIQQERVTSVLRACRDQNTRHDATIRSLDKLIKRVPPSRRTRAIQSRAGTVLLIDALAPRHNCRKLAAQAVPSR